LLIEPGLHCFRKVLSPSDGHLANGSAGGRSQDTLGAFAKLALGHVLEMVARKLDLLLRNLQSKFFGFDKDSVSAIEGGFADLLVDL
jgi:hypothetical protein